MCMCVHVTAIKEKRGYEFEKEQEGEHMAEFGGRQMKGKLCNYNIKV